MCICFGVTVAMQRALLLKYVTCRVGAISSGLVPLVSFRRNAVFRNMNLLTNWHCLSGGSRLKPCWSNISWSGGCNRIL